MALNPTDNTPVFPITKVNPTSVAKSPYSTALKRQHDNQRSLVSSRPVARRSQRPIPFEKGGLVDLYA